MNRTRFLKMVLATAIVVSVMALLLQLNYASAQSGPSTGKLEGTVADAHSHKHLAGAKVTWSRPGSQSAVQGATDALGRFSFAIPITGGVTQNTISLSVQANAYQPLKETAVVHTAGITQVKVALLAEPSSKIGTVSGTVKNARSGKQLQVYAPGHSHSSGRCRLRRRADMDRRPGVVCRNARTRR